MALGPGGGGGVGGRGAACYSARNRKARGNSLTNLHRPPTPSSSAPCPQKKGCNRFERGLVGCGLRAFRGSSALELWDLTLAGVDIPQTLNPKP